MSRPSDDELHDMVLGYIDTLATDGCVVEPDGTCEHNCDSWLVELELI